MLLDRVRAFSPLDRLLYWVGERESIRLKKEAGEPKPWTDDPILRAWRFCNVRRMDDKVSRWLLENWYLPNRGHRNMLAAVALARFINLPGSLGHLGFPKRWDPERIKAKLREYRGSGNGPLFNSAYMVRGNDGVDKIESVVDHNVGALVKSRVKVDPTSMEATHKRIAAVYGFGSFMAGQVVADLRWAVEGSWADRNSWAPEGPGSRRGMNRLHGRVITFSLPEEQFRGELSGIIKEGKRRLSRSITGRMEAMDYQNCLCEFDKYERVLNGEGRPKSTYPGG